MKLVLTEITAAETVDERVAARRDEDQSRGNCVHHYRK
jgi:hypothetical protein